MVRWFITTRALNCARSCFWMVDIWKKVKPIDKLEECNEWSYVFHVCSFIVNIYCLPIYAHGCYYFLYHFESNLWLWFFTPVCFSIYLLRAQITSSIIIVHYQFKKLDTDTVWYIVHSQIRWLSWYCPSLQPCPLIQDPACVQLSGHLSLLRSRTGQKKRLGLLWHCHFWRLGQVFSRMFLIWVW